MNVFFRKKIFMLLIVALTCNPLRGSNEKLGYSGRFVKSDGTPLQGPVNITVEILTGPSGSQSIRCTQNILGVSLSNGIFNITLDFASTCDGGTAKLTDILDEAFDVSSPKDSWIRVKTTSTTPIVAYGPHPLHATPVALHSVNMDIAAQAIQDINMKGVAANCSANKVLLSNGSGGFSCGDAPFTHPDTSSQSSVNNSGSDFIQDIALDSEGHVTSIVTASVGSSLLTQTTADARYLQLSGGNITGNITSSGSITANQFLYTSDKKFKKDIKTLDNPIEKLKQLNGVEFVWKNNGKKDIGFIAQDVQKVYPDLVEKIKTKEGDHLSVKYANMVAILLEAIKKQQQEIDQLKKQQELLLEDKKKRELASKK